MVDWPENGVTDWNTTMRAYVNLKCASAWVKFNAIGVGQGVSDNVFGVTRTAEGRYTVTWATDFATADYVCIVTGEDSVGRVNSMAAGEALVVFSNAATGADEDPTSGMVMAFGLQVGD